MGFLNSVSVFNFFIICVWRCGGEGGQVRGRGERGLLPLLPVEVPGGREVDPAQFALRPVNITWVPLSGHCTVETQGSKSRKKLFPLIKPKTGG